MDAAPLILIGEDDQAFSFILAATLESRGWEAIRAHTGIEVLRAARARRPDLVLMDVNLAGSNGVVLSDLLRDRLRGVPVLLMSALPEEDLRAMMAESGAVDVLPKPFSLSRLVKRIDRLLLQQQTAKEAAP